MGKTITTEDGQDRLSLQEDGGYFRALVWTRERGREWSCPAVITQTDFQRGAELERWVSDLHSLDPAAGTAIIKVAEMEAPPHEAGPRGFRRCVYSWREWDLLSNRQLRVLRVCADPFEDYEVWSEVKKFSLQAQSDSTVLIDCKHEHWDDHLYIALYNGQHTELLNLHPSYQSYMTQLAEHYCMEFIGHFPETRGEFKPLA